MPRRKDGAETSERILDAAAREFAAKGYANTTNADIVRRCGAINSALISYYFGDKANLYRQCWMYSHARSLEKYPCDKACDPTIPAARRLKSVIRSAVGLRSDPESFDVAILWHEIASPTGLLTDVYEKSVRTLRTVLREVVSELLGEAQSEELKRLTVLEVFAMCTIPVLQIQRLEGSPEYRYDSEERIEHIYNFAMAGIADMLRNRR